MPKVFSILAILLWASIGSYAQNWKTIAINDTTYFRGGLHESSIDEDFSTTQSPILKTILMDSISDNNGDTTCYFFKSIRTPGEGICIDSIAPSWLGSRFIHLANGTEYYFNSLDDTITINTQANLGDSWTLAKDNTNLIFTGTITAAGQTTVEGVPDSFKRISIQAYQNGNPVANPYNKVLEWSKDHGWLKTLDMYRFPNQLNGWEDFGAVTDSVQMIRLDNGFAHLDMNYIDLQWKYAPGNEWIRYHCWGTTTFGSPYNGAYKTITHDSVINSYSINQQSIAAEIQTKMYEVTDFSYNTTPPPPFYWDSTITTTITIHTDTITNAPGEVIVNTLKPEVVDTSISYIFNSNADHDILYKFFADTLCERPVTGEAIRVFNYIGEVNGCWQVLPSVSGGSATSSSTLYGFGTIRSLLIYSGMVLQSPDFYDKVYYSYLKLPGCTIGNKIDVIALSSKNITKQNNIIVYPSPAHDHIMISSSLMDKDAVISLIDITGKELLRSRGLQASNKLQLNSIPSGIYFIKVLSNTIRETQKVIIE